MIPQKVREDTSWSETGQLLENCIHSGPRASSYSRVCYCEALPTQNRGQSQHGSEAPGSGGQRLKRGPHPNASSPSSAWRREGSQAEPGQLCLTLNYNKSSEEQKGEKKCHFNSCNWKRPANVVKYEWTYSVDKHECIHSTHWYAHTHRPLTGGSPTVPKTKRLIGTAVWEHL